MAKYNLIVSRLIETHRLPPSDSIPDVEDINPILFRLIAPPTLYTSPMKRALALEGDSTATDNTLPAESNLPGTKDLELLDELDHLLLLTYLKNPEKVKQTEARLMENASVSEEAMKKSADNAALNVPTGEAALAPVTAANTDMVVKKPESLLSREDGAEELVLVGNPIDGGKLDGLGQRFRSARLSDVTWVAPCLTVGEVGVALLEVVALLLMAHALAEADAHLVHLRGEEVLHARSLHGEVEGVFVGQQTIGEVQISSPVGVEAEDQCAVRLADGLEIAVGCVDVLHFAVKQEGRLAVVLVEEDNGVALLVVVVGQCGADDSCALGADVDAELAVAERENLLLAYSGAIKGAGGVVHLFDKTSLLGYSFGCGFFILDFAQAILNGSKTLLLSEFLC